MALLHLKRLRGVSASDPAACAAAVEAARPYAAEMDSLDAALAAAGYDLEARLMPAGGAVLRVGETFGEVA